MDPTISSQLDFSCQHSYLLVENNYRWGIYQLFPLSQNFPNLFELCTFPQSPLKPFKLKKTSFLTKFLYFFKDGTLLIFRLTNNPTLYFIIISKENKIYEEKWDGVLVGPHTLISAKWTILLFKKWLMMFTSLLKHYDFNTRKSLNHIS